MLSRTFLLLPGVAFSLGAWQVYRWDWKQKQLAFREERRVADPIAWTGTEDLDGAATEFKRVTTRGRFDHFYEVRVGPRSCEGESGFFVVTPLQLEGGRRVLVNRGWAPRDATELWRPDGVVDVVGVVRRSEQQGTFTPNNDLTAGQVFWMDHAALNAALRCDSNVRLEEVQRDNPSVVPLGGQTVFWMPNNHATYVATWWSLGAALTLIWRRGRRVAARR